jgi:hypothetical protein
LTYEKGARFPLIAGQRRYEAAKMLGWESIRTTVVDTDDAQEILEIEIAENESRKEFTVSEKLDFAARLKVVEEAKARERKSLYARDGYKDQDVVNWPHPEIETGETKYDYNEVMDEGISDSYVQDVGDRPHPEKEAGGVTKDAHSVKGRARDIIAKKAGFTSTSQMRRAETIAMKRPDLLGEIDAGRMSIHGAAETMKREEREERANCPERPSSVRPSSVLPVAEQFKTSPKEVGASVKRLKDTYAEVDNIGIQRPSLYTPQWENATGEDTLEGAGHQQLMRNPVYAKLFSSYQELIEYSDKLRTLCEGRLQGGRYE